MAKRKYRAEEWRTLLQEAGLRATPARIEVLDLLAAAGKPLSHAEAADRLKATEHDRSTIFRVLQDLTESGLIRRLELGDHVWRYERVEQTADDGGEIGPHPHLLCLDCGTITCLTEGQVRLNLPRRMGTVEDVLIKGHCADCLD